MYTGNSSSGSTVNDLLGRLFDSLDGEIGSKSDFEIYQSDPVGFGETVLDETYTDEVKILMESVRDHVVTIASPDTIPVAPKKDVTRDTCGM